MNQFWSFTPLIGFSWRTSYLVLLLDVTLPSSLSKWDSYSGEFVGVQPCRGVSLLRGPKYRRCHPFLLVPSTVGRRGRNTLSSGWVKGGIPFVPYISLLSIHLVNPSPSLLLSFVSGSFGHLSKPTIESHGRSSPRVSSTSFLISRVTVVNYNDLIFLFFFLLIFYYLFQIPLIPCGNSLPDTDHP